MVASTMNPMTKCRGVFTVCPAWMCDVVYLPNSPRLSKLTARPGYSSYERYGISGYFSHMTHEQLVNWSC